MANELYYLASDSGRIGSGVSGYLRNLSIVGHVASASEYFGGAFRFTNIAVAQGTTVNHASIYHEAGAQGAGGGNLNFVTYGIDEDNTNDFTADPFSRDKTTASDTSSNVLPGVGNFKQITVTSIVNEILARGSWSSGNAMGFLMEDHNDQNSDNDCYIRDPEFGGSMDSYLIIREDAEPDFTPTPITISAPSLPAADSYGIKISKPGVSVLTATEADLYFTTRRKQFKVVAEGQVTTSANPHHIAHSQGVTPFAEVFVKSGDYWFRLPFMNFSGGSNIGYMTIDATNVDIYAGIGVTAYYYVFIDELAS